MIIFVPELPFQYVFRCWIWFGYVEIVWVRLFDSSLKWTGHILAGTSVHVDKWFVQKCVYFECLTLRWLRSKSRSEIKSNRSSFTQFEPARFVFRSFCARWNPHFMYSTVLFGIPWSITSAEPNDFGWAESREGDQENGDDKPCEHCYRDAVNSGLRSRSQDRTRDWTEEAYDDVIWRTAFNNWIYLITAN